MFNQAFIWERSIQALIYCKKHKRKFINTIVFQDILKFQNLSSFVLSTMKIPVPIERLYFIHSKGKKDCNFVIPNPKGINCIMLQFQNSELTKCLNWNWVGTKFRNLTWFLQNYVKFSILGKWVLVILWSEEAVTSPISIGLSENHRSCNKVNEQIEKEAKLKHRTKIKEGYILGIPLL